MSHPLEPDNGSESRDQPNPVAKTGTPVAKPPGRNRKRLLWLVVLVALAPLVVIHGFLGGWSQLPYAGLVAVTTFWILLIPVLLWVFADE